MFFFFGRLEVKGLEGCAWFAFFEVVLILESAYLRG